MSEEQKIIDLENEISFLKDALCEKQKEIDEKSTIIMAGAEKVKQLEKEIEDFNEIKQQICNEELITQDYVKDNFVAKDKIREAIENRNIELYADEPDNDFIPFDEVIDTLKELLEENINE